MTGRKLFSLGAAVLFFLSAGAGYAGQKEDASKLVDEAVKFFEKEGKDKAIAEIGKEKGKFDKGEVYVFAYDLNGVMLAHPKNAKLVGKNLLEVPDANGKTFRKDIVTMAKGAGSGWVDYMYKNPENGNVEPKTTYVKKAGDMVFCAGAYK